MKSKQVVFRVTDELHTKIKIESAKQEIAMTEYFMRMIDKFLGV